MTHIQGVLFVIILLGMVLGWLLKQVSQGRTSAHKVLNLTITVLAAWAFSILFDYCLR